MRTTETGGLLSRGCVGSGHLTVCEPGVQLGIRLEMGDVSGFVTARLRKPLERGVVASMAVCWSFGLLVSGCSDVLESPKGDSFGGTCRDHVIAEGVLFQRNVLYTCDRRCIVVGLTTLTREFTRICLFDGSFSQTGFACLPRLCLFERGARGAGLSRSI